LQASPSIDCVYFISDQEPVDLESFAQGRQTNEIQVLRLFKFLKQKTARNAFVDCYLLTLDNFRDDGTSTNPHGGGITGMGYSIAQGDHRFLVRNIDMSKEDLINPETQKALLKMILNERASDRGDVIKFKSGSRYRQVFFKLDWENFKKKSGLKKGGVYVILGGSGKVGGIITRYLIRDYQAKVVWIGRSPETSDAVQEKIASLHGLGEQPLLYVQADATQSDSMRQAVKSIKKKYPEINGAIFSGAVFDLEISMDQITETEFQNILDVKTSGSICFYKAFHQVPLDFMCYFSSVQSFSFISSKDSSGYAAGITFSDAFVKSVGKNCHFPIGIINWGYWEASVVGTMLERRLAGHFGLIPDMDGFEFFEKFTYLLQKGISNQIICLRTSEAVRNLMHCNEEKAISFCEQSSDGVFRQKMVHCRIPDEAENDGKEEPPASGAGQADITASSSIYKISRENTRESVKSLMIDSLSQSLKISEADIENDMPFSDYGIDSILGASFVTHLSNQLGVTMNTAILFDYTTVDRLTNYIFDTYKDQIKIEKTCFQNSGTDSGKPKIRPSLQERNSLAISETTPVLSESAAIAVIGMSGQFPGAEDVNAFWRNLINGKDGVRELPSQYLDPKYVNSGKTCYKWGGVLQERDCFDPLFFNISPREAESMNPHQRLILQESWKGLEDAGYNPRSLVDSHVGIFIGAEPAGYVHESFTGASDAIIASRLSYFLNLKGPAMVVNTGCSSSAVGIHLACESLRNKESGIALAGGVFATMDQTMLIPLSESGMLSPTGQCHTFDESGDGTVLSEGVGIVVLKRLKDAIDAGDFIYGVIQGTGVNQDGASNGITAPNGIAQESLITDVYRRHSINPEEISYIEAHGTGTILGDLVEANALVRAFRQFTAKKHYCAVGSAKSHIGHTSASAGVIGLIKILLSMRHHQIPGLLYFKRLNPLIEFEDSAFYVNTKLSEWRSENHQPLMAALNSFGHSGTNVHLVVKEYIPSRKAPESPISLNEDTALVPLSAKTEESLKAYTKKLWLFLKAELSYRKEKSQSSLLSGRVLNPVNIAYTLQVGREDMTERVVFLIRNISELMEKLQDFSKGKQAIEHCWKGQTDANKSKLHLFASDEDAQEMIARWVAKGKLGKIAELWAQGITMDWNLLYGEVKPDRISLPTYPFAKERYWVPVTDSKTGSKPIAASLHPLLHRNTSDFSEQRFSSTFTGQEFFLVDHRVQGQKVLPGVAFLEMARAAVEQAAGSLAEPLPVRLRNIVWTRPITVNNHAQEVHIGLFAEENGLIHYEIYTEPEDTLQLGEIKESVIHSQGLATFSRSSDKAALMNIAELRAGINRNSFSAEQCYSAFKSMGVDYGPGHRGIETVYVENGQALAKLALPSPVFETRDQFVLHPSIMDSALQASIGLAMRVSGTPGRDDRPYLPYALEELEITRQCTANMWAWIRYSDGSAPEDKIQKLDIDLCDDEGQVCVRMKRFTSRMIQMEDGHDKTVGTLMYQPARREQSVAREGRESEYSQHSVAKDTSWKEEAGLKETTKGRSLSISSDRETLRENALRYFKKLLSSTLKVPAYRIRDDESFEKYGIDSIMVTQLTNELEKTFGSLSKTLFFEYQNIREITEFFLESYEEEIRGLLNTGAPAKAAIEHEQKPLISEDSLKRRPRGFRFASVKGVSSATLMTESPDIAIIGLSGRYPQARNPEEYWDNLRDGKDCITEIPEDRWDWREYYTEDRSQWGGHYSKWGGFIEDVDKFDPLFFNISPLEAEFIDPQERLFLEHTWMALEDAGYCRESLKGNVNEDYLPSQVGVYAGVMYGEYQLFGAEASLRGNRISAGGSYASIANRVSYILNLHGPSMTMDTMCSSSLTCLHLACQDLKLGRTDMGIAGGVNVTIHPNKYLMLSAGQFISTSGHCESFGRGADGYIPGEGVGVALLKRLADAERDGDHIYAVIKGSAINHGGKTNGYSVPNPNAQQMVIERALKESRIDPRRISYIEAHGTGTKLGDPIEITGLTKAFRKYTQEKQYCRIGSVKSNIGHCESAAGIAGVTKILLQMQQGQIVPSLHSEVLNPNIDFTATPFVVNQKLREWERPIIDGEVVPRIAGISSFGAGGSNAHILIEEYISGDLKLDIGNQGMETGDQPCLVVLSAMNEERLKEYAANLLKFIQKVTCRKVDGQASREFLEERICVMLSEILQVDKTEIELEEKFQDYGAETIHQTRLLEKMAEEFGLDFDLKEFRGKNSVASVVAYLSSCFQIPMLDTKLEGDRKNKRGETKPETKAEINLANLAYTLQVGREAMRERLGLLVGSVPELEEKLRAFSEGRDNSEELYRGKVNRNDDSLAILTADEDMSKTIDTWISKRKYSKLLDLWVKGLDFDWNKLYGKSKPSRISLPTYPFARERYWVDLKLETGNLKLNTGKQDLALHHNSISGEPYGMLMCHPVWKAKAISEPEDFPEYSQRLIILCNLDSFDPETIETQIKSVSCIRLQPERNTLEKSYQDVSIQAFETIKELLGKKIKGKILLQILISSKGEERLFSGLSGLLRTARLEYPKFSGQIIEVDPGETEAELIRKLRENSRSPKDARIRYHKGQRQIVSWDAIIPDKEAKPIPWKDNGIYLITGGAGGLGLIFAREIAEKTKDATLILTGRSRLNQEKKDHLREIESLGIRIRYKKADVSRQKVVDTFIQSVGEDFGQINGILHSAGIIRDNFIIRKTAEEFKTVLAPKVAGTVNLDIATRNLDLDFFVLFSSGAGVLGNPGQADYATANAFMDAYAEFRNELLASEKRRGHTLSVNWPLWKEGGMRVDEATEKMMKQSAGIVPLENFHGIQALIRGLATNHSQLMVMQGDLPRLRQIFPGDKALEKETSAVRETIVHIDKKHLQEKTLQKLKHLLGAIIKLPGDRIDSQEPLESYGIDSVMIAHLNQKLETIFGELSKTLLYEYQTLSALADYFTAEHYQECMAWTGVEEPDAFQSDTVTDPLVLNEEFSAPASLKSENTRTQHFTLGKAKDEAPEPIAIIGMSGRYPQADTLEAYWENLKAGKDCITEIPKDRWSLEGFFHPDPEEAISQGKSYGKWGGFLEGFANFDPLFFNISPREAMNMDPQGRLFLEECWRAFEDAGYSPTQINSELRNHIGVYGAVTKVGFNTSFSSLVNRVSYVMDFHGPSIPVDTMCSSALAALHQACGNLRHQDIHIALVGAVNLYLYPHTYFVLSQSRLLADSHQPAVFGKGGKGFVPSEGVGAVVLKRLSDAEKDSDAILGIIRGSAVNHNGKTNGYGAPSPQQQRAVIQQALENAQVDPRSVGYIESAAIGSEMGDAIEMAALSSVFQACRDNGKESYRIGSLKSILGHGESVSAMAQFMKVVLQLNYKTLCPTRVPEQLNPNINFDSLPFEIQTELSEWPQLILEGTEIPRRAGISSMGAGGVNAHLIVEEYIAPREEVIPIHSESSPQIVVLSAKNEDRLLAVVRQLAEFISDRPKLCLPDLAYTLQVGRKAMEFRVALIVKTQQELIQGLKDYLQSVKEKNGGETYISTYTGNTEEESSKIQSLLSGETGEIVLQSFLAGKNLEKLALYWVQGGRIPWETLHEGKKVRRISLPAYPFDKQRYWAEDQPMSEPVAMQNRTMNDSAVFVEIPYTSVEDAVMAIVSDLLGMKMAELNCKKPLEQYGFDSILLMRLTQELQARVNPSADLARLKECKTVQDIVAVLPAEFETRSLLMKQSAGYPRESVSQFPELIHLNQISQGQPVFWFHGGLGGVEAYQIIAEKCPRPFYGIQARGWMTDRSPLHGVEAMAAYYVHVIQSVQPDGPYDLGGYSLGGVLAYETTRQLQELGQVVSSIVMLDSYDRIESEKDGFFQKKVILGAVNVALQSAAMPVPEKYAKTLIHRDEVDSGLDDEAFLKQLLVLARTRGLTKTGSQLRTMIQQMAKLGRALETDHFSILPLPDPQSVSCHYFRNKSGLFYGDLEPYYTLKDGQVWVPDNTNYWSEWEKQLPDFHITDVDSSNHTTLLSEPEACVTILEFCKSLYSEEGISH